MYLYSFDRFFGFDKVCILAENTSTKSVNKKKVKTGDLLVFGNQYFLAIGKTLVFPEQYLHLETIKAELIYKEFMTQPTLKLFHWMVETYYTTYKSVVRLFVTNDIQKLLEREEKLKASKKIPARSRPQNLNAGMTGRNEVIIPEEWQTLIVFPDLRTMFNSTSEQFRESEGVAFLSATQTEKQKDVHRWEIKKGMKSVILCTYAEIFQDFYDLKKIIFVDPHKRYYANQQDPRYKVGEVIEEMKKLYSAEVEVVGV